MHKDLSIAGGLAYSADMFLKRKTVCLHYVIPEMHSFSMRPAKYFYDKPLPIYLDLKTVLIYRPHLYRGRILGRHPDKGLECFFPCYSQPPALRFLFFKLTQPLIVSRVPYGFRNPYRNLKSDNSQDYAQKPQRICTFMSAS